MASIFSSGDNIKTFKYFIIIINFNKMEEKKMVGKEELLKNFNYYSGSVSNKQGIDYSKISRLRRRGYMFDRLVLEWHGRIGYLFPLTILITILSLGYFVGIFESEICYEAQISYVFWAIFITLSTYLLDLFVDAITNAMQESDHAMNIKFEKHKKILDFMFGFKGVIITCLIALPFILYDITGLGNFDEGWINDIHYYYEMGDTTWYPHISDTVNGVGFGSILWLVIWIIPWFYFGAFIWLSFAFMVYVNAMMKNATWRDDIKTVIRQKQYNKLLGLSIAAYIPLAPFLAIKLIFQIFFLPWNSDIIATYLLFIVFCIAVIISPIFISKDISREKKKTIKAIQNIGFNAFESTVNDIVEGKNVDILSLMKADLMYTYVKESTEFLSKRIIDKKLIYKVLFAAMGPIISFLVKIILSGGI